MEKRDFILCVCMCVSLLYAYASYDSKIGDVKKYL